MKAKRTSLEFRISALSVIFSINVLFICFQGEYFWKEDEEERKNCETPPPKFVVVFDVNAQQHIMAGFAELMLKYEAFKKKFPDGQVSTLNVGNNATAHYYQL
ncbi:MAG TPA: hypothetical protein VK145_02650 [Candidatus Nanoarchaeia archaeon]|nr:hypothetical protein [Candidatus Nanoarchaeia archaeon]